MITMPAIKLRPYQESAIEAVLSSTDAWRKLIVMATGSGKTVVMSSLIDRMLGAGGRALVLAHREELLTQAQAEIEGLVPDLHVELEQAQNRATREHHLFTNAQRHVVVGSVQTLRGKRLESWAPDSFDVVLIDECFPAGTLVDGMPIESLQIGDKVSAFDENANSIIESRVMRLFKSVPKHMVRVHIANRTIACTAGHPFWTRRGWVPAIELTSEDCVGISLHRMPYADFESGQASTRRLQKNGKNLLHNRLRHGLQRSQVIRNDGRDQSQIRFGSHESSQSHVKARISGENDRNASYDEAQAENSRRKRDGTISSRANHVGRIRLSLDAESCSYEDVKGQRIPYALQNRFSPFRFDAGNRNRRVLARPFRAQKTRQKEGRVLEFAGVDHIEVLQQTSDGTFGGVCPDGYVYNIEVKKQHTYIAEGFVVHNCHHAAAKSYVDIFSHFGCLDAEKRTPLIGVTATPNRSDGVGLGVVFQKISAVYAIRELVEMGFLCGIRTINVKSEVDISKVKMSAGDFAARELQDTIDDEKRNALIVAAYKKYAADRPAVAFTAGVEHAMHLAHWFSESGIPAEAVYGAMDPDERKGALQRFHVGQTQILTNHSLLTEGFNEPKVACIILGRPTKSSLVLTQQIGRGTRLAPGKADCLVIDVKDVTNGKSLCSVPSLAGLPANFDPQGSDIFAAAKKWEKLDPRLAHQANSLEYVDTALKQIENGMSILEIDIMAATAVDPYVEAHSQFLWTARTDEHYELSPDKTAMFSIIADTLGTWHISYRPSSYESAKPIGTTDDLPAAFKLADKIISQQFPSLSLVGRTAAWRNHPASMNQIATLDKLKKDYPPTITKGQASALITALLSHKKLR